MDKEIYEFDKTSGQLFCKGCGNNYLLKEHKESCNLVCPACKGLGYIEYETGVEHCGIVEIAKDICGCQLKD